jgi:multimeric flavodoxin WrbA
VEEQLRADGHAVDAVHITDFTVAGCSECLACKSGDIELCVIEDDANGFFRRMADADAVLLAAPVFCWGFPAQIKGLIDRMYCLMDFEGEPGPGPRLHHKPMGLLVTAGGDEEDNAELLIRGFENLVDLLKATLVGHLTVPGCTVPEALSEDIREEVTEFARAMAARGR